jgi:hypothetical protein
MKSGIIYKGPSRIDGAPIVVLATYSNRNTKTGAVVQTYILRDDENINPLGSKQDRRGRQHLRHMPIARHAHDRPGAQASRRPPVLCQP